MGVGENTPFKVIRQKTGETIASASVIWMAAEAAKEISREYPGEDILVVTGTRVHNKIRFKPRKKQNRA